MKNPIEIYNRPDYLKGRHYGDTFWLFLFYMVPATVIRLRQAIPEGYPPPCHIARRIMPHERAIYIKRKRNK